VRPIVLSVLALLISGCGLSPSGNSTSVGVGLESIETTSRLTASRSFAGPDQFPPSEFAGYGIIAFPANPNAADASKERFLRFCRAFHDSFVASDVLAQRGVLPQDQMVTVLPLMSQAAARDASLAVRDDACALALKTYDLATAQQAIQNANFASKRTDGIGEVRGRGPFLLAWSPGAAKGDEDTIVLVSDLSNSVSVEQVHQDMQYWKDEVQKQPQLWRDGWNTEFLRLTLQKWFDRYGTRTLKIIGEIVS